MSSIAGGQPGTEATCNNEKSSTPHSLPSASEERHPGHMVHIDLCVSCNTIGWGPSVKAHMSCRPPREGGRLPDGKQASSRELAAALRRA